MSLSSRAAISLSRSVAKSAVRVQTRNASGGGGYNLPTGRLFNEKPVPKGQKRQKEEWEQLWYWGMFGGIGLAVVILMYKPDTSLQTWAKQEAMKRLQDSDKIWKYSPSANSGYPPKEGE